MDAARHSRKQAGLAGRRGDNRRVLAHYTTGLNQLVESHWTYDHSALPLAAPGSSLSAVPGPGTVALFLTALLGILLAVVRRKPR